VMRIDKKSIVKTLHRERAFSDMFVASLLARGFMFGRQSFWELLVEVFGA